MLETRLTIATLFVTDPYPPGPQAGQPISPADKPGLLQRIAELLHPSPEGIEGLLEQLAIAQSKQLIDADDRRMLEGVLRMNDMTAGDVMVAAPPYGHAGHQRAFGRLVCPSYRNSTLALSGV